MRGHRSTPSRRDRYVTPAAISPPGVACGRFFRGHQSGLAGCKPASLFMRGASSCPSQQQRQQAIGRLSTTEWTYLRTYLGRLTPGSYSTDELLFWLVAKIPRDVWDECRGTAQRKARTLTYEYLSVLLLELALEKEDDQYLNTYRPGGGSSGNHGRVYQGPRAGQRTTPKNARYMSNVQHLFWCDARDERGGLMHAPDCD